MPQLTYIVIALQNYANLAVWYIQHSENPIGRPFALASCRPLQARDCRSFVLADGAAAFEAFGSAPGLLL